MKFILDLSALDTAMARLQFDNTDLANKLKVTRSRIYHLRNNARNGKPTTPKMAGRIAKALGKDVLEIVRRDGEVA